MLKLVASAGSRDTIAETLDLAHLMLFCRKKFVKG